MARKLYPKHVTDVILMEIQFFFFLIPQCHRIMIYVLLALLCANQIAFNYNKHCLPFPPLGCPEARIEKHYKQMLHEDVWSTFVHMGPSGYEKKEVLNYMIFLLIGFSGSFSKPLSQEYIFIEGEGNYIPLKYQPTRSSSQEVKKNILVSSILVQCFQSNCSCRQWICNNVLLILWYCYCAKTPNV